MGSAYQAVSQVLAILEPLDAHGRRIVLGAAMRLVAELDGEEVAPKPEQHAKPVEHASDPKDDDEPTPPATAEETAKRAARLLREHGPLPSSKLLGLLGLKQKDYRWTQAKLYLVANRLAEKRGDKSATVWHPGDTCP